MKKNILFLLVGLLFLTTFVLAEEIDTTEQKNNILEKKIDFEYSNFLGIPEPITIRLFIIFGCLFLIALSIIYELIDFSGFIEKKWINFGISFILVLVSSYNKILYIITLQIESISNIGEFLTTSSFLKIIIGFLVLGIFFAILKILLKNLKQSSELERIEREAQKMRAVSKIEKIKQTAYGIK